MNRPTSENSNYFIENPFIRVFKSESFAWSIIIGLFLFTFLGIGVGGAKALNLLFPFGSLAIAVFLYFRFPLLYVGFVWWLWLLTPFIRRLVDFKTSYTETSPVLLAPLFATSVTVITLVRYIPKLIRSYGLPFIITVSSILFCLALGFVNFKITRVLENFLEILLPVSFGFHIIVNWHYYPAYRDNIRKIFVWGVVVMGIYGIFQYFVCPQWDAIWLINSDYNSGGNPAPQKLRVWSTLNSAGPFAAIMGVGLLLLLDTNSKLKGLAYVVGGLSFLLSRHRSSWVSWILGFALIAGSSPPKKQLRMVIFVSIFVLLLVGLGSLEQFSDTIGGRFESLSSLEDDGSALARKAEWDEFLLPALSSLFGDGLGGLGHDNGILYFLLNLGWTGTVLYFAGLFMPIVVIYQSPFARQDNFIVVARSISISLLIQMPTSIPVLHVTGMAIWGFASYAMAGHLYYKGMETHHWENSALPAQDSQENVVLE